MAQRGLGLRLWPTLPRLALAASLGFPVLAPGVAQAEPAQVTSAADIARARALFGEGRALLDEQRWAAAAAKFREAAAIKNTPGLRYHIALCEEKLAHLLEAETEYLIARGLLADQPAEDVAELIGPALTRLEQAVPRVMVLLTSSGAGVAADVPNARIEVDGNVVDALTLRGGLRLNPGRHTLRVVALEHEPFVAEVDAVVAETVSVPVQLVRRKAEPGPAPAPPASAADGTSWRTVTLIGTATLSAAGLGVGVWGLVERSAAVDRVERHEEAVRKRAGYLEGACSGASSDLTGPCADLETSLDEQDRATAFAVGGFATALTGLAATAVTLLYWPDESVTVRAAYAPERGGLLVSGRF